MTKSERVCLSTFSSFDCSRYELESQIKYPSAISRTGLDLWSWFWHALHNCIDTRHSIHQRQGVQLIYLADLCHDSMTGLWVVISFASMSLRPGYIPTSASALDFSTAFNSDLLIIINYNSSIGFFSSFVMMMRFFVSAFFHTSILNYSQIPKFCCFGNTYFHACFKLFR